MSTLKRSRETTSVYTHSKLWATGSVLCSGLIILGCCVELVACKEQTSRKSFAFEYRLAAELTIVDHILSNDLFSKPSFRKLPSRVDLFQTQGSRYKILYSQRSDSIVLYRIESGQFNGTEIELEGLGRAGILTGDSAKMYVDLIKTDSIGQFVVSTSSSTISGREKTHIGGPDERSEKNNDVTISRYIYQFFLLAGGNDRKATYSSPVFPTDCALALAFLHDDKLGRFVKDSLTISTVDWSIKRDRNFATIVCRRDEHKGAYAIAVGRLEGHLMTYRLLGNTIHTLEGKALHNYIDLLVNDKIWSLIGPEGFWESEESMNRLYDSYFNDSTTADYKIRTLHLDSLFEDGYLEQAVR